MSGWLSEHFDDAPMGSNLQQSHLRLARTILCDIILCDITGLRQAAVPLQDHAACVYPLSAHLSPYGPFPRGPSKPHWMPFIDFHVLVLPESASELHLSYCPLTSVGVSHRLNPQISDRGALLFNVISSFP